MERRSSEFLLRLLQQRWFQRQSRRSPVRYPRLLWRLAGSAISHDPDTSNRTRHVENAIFTRVDLTPTRTEPTFIIGSSFPTA